MESEQMEILADSKVKCKNTTSRYDASISSHTQSIIIKVNCCPQCHMPEAFAYFLLQRKFPSSEFNETVHVDHSCNNLN